jgi:hypothetical protein
VDDIHGFRAVFPFASKPDEKSRERGVQNYRVKAAAPYYAPYFWQKQKIFQRKNPLFKRNIKVARAARKRFYLISVRLERGNIIPVKSIEVLRR